MKDQINQILSGLPGVRVNAVGKLWQVSVGGLSGARENGISLAQDLKAQYEFRKAREAPVPRPESAYRDEPEDIAIPAFLKDSPDPRDAKIAALEAAIAAAAAPPEELRQFIREGEAYGEAQERLWALYNELTTLLMMGQATPEQGRMHSRLHGALYWIGRGAVEVTI